MSDSLSDQLAAGITVALAEHPMSQADLARHMGLSAKHVNHMVNGKSGALGMYDYAAHVLGLRWVVTLVPTERADLAASSPPQPVHYDGTMQPPPAV